MAAFRDLIKTLSPAMLQAGVGEREMYALAGLGLDGINEKRTQGIAAREPPYAQRDALNVIATDRVIIPGLTESNTSLAVRLQTAFSSWSRAGSARAVLEQSLGYVLATTPAARTVSVVYDLSTYPGLFDLTEWDAYPTGRSYAATPDHFEAAAGDPTAWNWDSASLVDGTASWWGAWLILESVAPNDWTSIAPGWGTGSTWAGSGYYSTVSSGAYVASSAYSGASQAWGAGSTYAGAGDYSTVVNGAYVAASSYNGDTQAWGVTAKQSTGLALQSIARTFKGAHAWIRAIIVSFDSALFDCTPGTGGNMPDGHWGQWSKLTGAQYLPSRYANCAYGGEVI